MFFECFHNGQLMRIDDDVQCMRRFTRQLTFFLLPASRISKEKATHRKAGKFFPIGELTEE
jgi:hypothetical protein